MSVIHKICGTELISSGNPKVSKQCLESEGYLGDYGYCLTCKKVVHHLIVIGTKGGIPYPDFSDKVIIS